MSKKSKPISGLSSRSRVIHQHLFTDQQKHTIIQEYLSTGAMAQSIWKKYTGHPKEHGQIKRWMRQLGYLRDEKKPIPKHVKSQVMSTKEDSSQEKFEQLQLQKRILELEKELKDAQMRAIAYSTMIDIAEKELNISIRKKFNTKPSKP